MSENPMMMARKHAAREAKLKADFEAESAAERAKMEAATIKLQDALLKAKREKRNAGPITGGRRRHRQHNKKGFGSQQVDNDGEDPETDLLGFAEIELVVTTDNRGEKQATQKKKQKKKKKKVPKGRQHRLQTASSSDETSSTVVALSEPHRPESVGDYDTVMDHSTGRPYYVHRQTGVSSWTIHDDDDSAVMIEGTNPAFSSYNTSRSIAPSSVHERQRSFRRHRTASGNREYFEEVGTGLTVWSLPKDSIVL